MTDYDNRGQISLWKNESTNQSAPQAKGTFIAHRNIKEGEEIQVALWRERNSNPNAPMMRGKISDKYQPGQQSSSPPPPDNFDDDIPF